MPTFKKAGVYMSINLWWLSDYEFSEVSGKPDIFLLKFRSEFIGAIGTVSALLKHGFMTADCGGKDAHGYVFLMLGKERSSHIYPDFDSCLYAAASEHHEDILYGGCECG